MLIDIYEVDSTLLTRHSYLNSNVISFLVELSYTKFKLGKKHFKFYRIFFMDENQLGNYYNIRHEFYISKRDFKKLRREK